MKKLVCDRCGLELSDRWDILLALEGKRAWQAACRKRGVEPRGVLPCTNYMHCGGEIKPAAQNSTPWWQRWLKKSPD